MGIVLSFTPQKAGMKKPSGLCGMAAAVVIFPGVRYERADETAPAREGQCTAVPADGAAPSPKH